MPESITASFDFLCHERILLYLQVTIGENFLEGKEGGLYVCYVDCRESIAVLMGCWRFEDVDGRLNETDADGKGRQYIFGVASIF